MKSQMKSRLIHSIHRTILKPTQILGISAISLGLCITLLLGLCWLFQEVWEKEVFGFDRSILLIIHQWSNPSLDSLMISVTRLGDPEWVVGVIVGTLCWLGLKRCYPEVIMFTIACLGAFVLNSSMKVFFAKARPELWTRLIPETSFSFPSGHALGSIVLYGAIAYLLSRQVPKKSRLFYGIAIGIVTAIGFSRLYLGVHWPTDILAGYGIGFLWLITCTILLQFYDRKVSKSST